MMKSDKTKIKYVKNHQYIFYLSTLKSQKT